MAKPALLFEGAIQLNSRDNVAVAARHLSTSDQVAIRGQSIAIAKSIPFGHKLAIEPIDSGQEIRKYGQTIGFATEQIRVGEHVHVHNIECRAFSRDHAIASQVPSPSVAPEGRTFAGYLRDDNRVGTRNYIAVVSTVNCSASTVRRIVSHFTRERLADFPNVDGVFAVTHKTGCGMAESGIDRRNLNRCLSGFAEHPNVYGYVLIGLGCEVNQASGLIETHQLGKNSGKPPRVLTVQAAGGIERTVALGVASVNAMLHTANEVRRTPQPVSKLTLGTNCGGSDACSGITANPALGIVSDRIVAHGGTSILAETTEIYGAEHLLTRRAVSELVGRKLLDRIRWWEWYVSVFDAQINNNPSYGNKEGGLTTIFEKSLGAVTKGGSTALVDVVEYAERVKKPGLVFMDTPGFDPVSVTGIVAGGANLVVFTTGRGSVLGLKPSPTVKVATNSALFERMSDDMDFDAGTILNGESLESVGERLFELVLEVASGRRTKSEVLDVGDDEFVPWTVGPVL